MKMKQTLAIAIALAAGNLSLAQNYQVQTPGQTTSGGNAATALLNDQTLGANSARTVVRPASTPSTVQPRAITNPTNMHSPVATPVISPQAIGQNQNAIGQSYIDQGAVNNSSAVSGCGDCGCQSVSECDSCNSCSDRYLKFFGGWNNLQDIDARASALQGPIEFNSGWGLGAARGKIINCNWRREMEIVYRNNTVDTATGNSGNINALSFGNILIRDFNNVRLFGATPYAGIGAGGTYVDADFVIGGIPAAISDSAFAYQGLLGIQRQINDRVFGFAEYRYLGTSDLELEALGTDFDVKYKTQTVFFGIRINR